MSSSKPGDEVRAGVLRYLRTGVRSTQDVLQHLSRRGLSLQRATGLVATFQAQGLLDDRAAARLWAEHWARQHYADSAIRLKLLAKGFDEPLARNTIARLACDADDEERARRLLAQRLPVRPACRRGAGGRPDRGRGRVSSRLARLLASRGFDSELIERVLRTSRNLAASDSVNAER